MATTTIKWTQPMVLALIEEARKAGRIAAERKLQELQNAGPQWAVKDGQRTVGTLLDVCGSAWLKISARGKFFQIAKRISNECGSRIYCVNGYYGGGELSIFDSTHRQELSICRAACEGHAQVLRDYGIECSVRSRID